MHPSEWVDRVWHSSWIFKAFLALALGSPVWNWISSPRKEALSAAAETWPAVTGRVVAREIKEQYQGEEHEVTGFIAHVTYSYFLGEQQSGTYTRKFDSNDGAGEWLDLLYDKAVQVRVDPTKTSRSTLIESDLPLPPRTVKHLSTSIQPQGIRSNPAIFRLDLEAVEAGDSRPLITILSSVGLVLCCIIHVAGLFNKLDGKGFGFDLLFVMQIYAIAVGGYSSTLESDVRSGITTAQYKKEVESITPEKFRFAQKLLFGYSIVWMGALFYRSAVLHQNPEINPVPFFSAFQALFLLYAYCETQLPFWRQKGREDAPEHLQG
jgi:hypothetical protein